MYGNKFIKGCSQLIRILQHSTLSTTYHWSHSVDNICDEINLLKTAYLKSGLRSQEDQKSILTSLKRTAKMISKVTHGHQQRTLFNKLWQLPTLHQSCFYFALFLKYYHLLRVSYLWLWTVFNYVHDGSNDK